MRRYALTILCFCVVGWGAAAESPIVSTAIPTLEGSSPFQKVCNDFQAITFVQADFVETKTLHILSHPLQSSGTILFSPAKGVYRILLQPVHQELLITHSQLIQKDAEGTVQRMRVREQPAAQVFVDVFLSFFAGDRRGWEKTFAAQFSGSESDWKIILSPLRKSPAAKALREISLEGHEGILDQMTLTESNGDETKTVYSHQQISHAEVSDASLHFPTDLTSP